MARSHALIAALGTSLVLTGCPGAAEHEDAVRVERLVRAKLPFPVINEPRIGPTMYFAPGYWSTELKIYRVVNVEDQERIVSLVREARSMTSGKPVHIVFLQEEHFIQAGNLRKRSDEKVLRTVTVKD